MKRVLASITILATFGGAIQAGNPKPNILLIVSDDQGYGDFSIHGNPHLQTPHIDQLGQSGVRFDRFYVNSFCAPTRAALLTGRWPLRTGCHGVTHNREAMRPSEVTIAEALHDAGYRSACIGKWHNGEQYPFTPQGQGFDESFGFNNGHWNNYFDATLLRGAMPEPTQGYITDVLTDEAMKFIAANQTRPFFCYVAFNAPHSPYQVPDKYFDKFKAKGFDDNVAAFCGMCENIDDNVGRLLSQLDDLKLAENTVVVFLTDNGGTAGVKIYNAGMRGGKTSMHEGGTRVPLFIGWPAAKWQPHLVKPIVSHIDLFPTLLDLCGTELPQGPKLDGISLRPLLEKEDAATWPERILFTHNPIDETNMYPGAVRTQRHRLVREIKGPAGGSKAKANDGSATPWQLYDMETDPGQEKNIAAQNPDLVRQLSLLYNAWFADISHDGLQRFPLPIGHAEHNPVELHAPQAYYDPPLLFANGPGFANDWLTGWTDVKAKIWFDLDVATAGDYEIELDFACPPADAGSVVRVTIAGQALEATIPAASAPEIPLPHRDEDGKARYRNRHWQTLKFGHLTLPAGPTRLTLEPLSMPAGQVMDLKHVRLFLLIPAQAGGGEADHHDWYRDSIVNLHIDNHSNPVGKGRTADELAAMLGDIPVTMIQVSAFGAVGKATFPCNLNPVSDLGDWDTIAVWKQVAGRLNKRFGVYINTRGFDLSEKHPEWTQLNEQGRGKGKNGGLDVCTRPSPDKNGSLEKIFLPLVELLASRYRPDGVWVDGDHARTPTCYCPGCRAAWKSLTGKDAAPTIPSDADWPRWLAFEQERYDLYRQQMAETIHRVAPGCLYTSNHSWRFKSKDPRDAPLWADTLSGDLSHGAALELTRLSSMHLSAVQETPYDIMHYVNAQERGLHRVLQQGALAMASGGAWFLWCGGSTIVLPEAQDRVRLCAKYARVRQEALGASESLNPVAVLLSENDWQRKTCDGVEGWYDDVNPQNLAMALQDAGYGVDIVSEAILRRQAARYRVVFVMNQKQLASETFQALREQADGGATVVVAGEGLRPRADQDDATVTQWLGAARGKTSVSPRIADFGKETVAIRSVVALEARGADILVAASDGAPLLTRRPQGKGAVACLALPLFSYPDVDRLAGQIMQRLGFGPAAHIEGAARSEHLIFAFRGKPGQQIVHVTNLASHADGRRIVPASTESIDREKPLPSVELHLPAITEPGTVRVIPPETKLTGRQWSDGVLRLTLENLDVHAAILIDVATSGPAPLLPAATPLAEVENIGAHLEFDLKLETDTGSDNWYRGLPCRSPEFSKCGWVGVTSSGTKPAVFYLDDLLVERTAQ